MAKDNDRLLQAIKHRVEQNTDDIDELKKGETKGMAIAVSRPVSGDGEMPLLPTTTVTIDYAIATSDNVIEGDATSGDVELTLPEITTVNDGKTYHISAINIESNNVTITPNASDTLDRNDDYTFVDHEVLHLQANLSTNNWKIFSESVPSIKQINTVINGATTFFDVSRNVDITKVDITAGEGVFQYLDDNGSPKVQRFSYDGVTAHLPSFEAGAQNVYLFLAFDFATKSIVIKEYAGYDDVVPEVGLRILFYAVITRNTSTNEIIRWAIDYHFPTYASPDPANRFNLLKKGSEKINGYIIGAETSNYGSVEGAYLGLSAGLAKTAGRNDSVNFYSAYNSEDSGKQGAEPDFESSTLGGRSNIGNRGQLNIRPTGSDALVFTSEKPWYEPEDGQAITYQGSITVAGDFPTTPDADDCYEFMANVTDNDPTKTNTGQSFLEGDVFKWDGVDTWVDAGYKQVPTDKVALYKIEVFPGSRIIILFPSDRVYDTINEALVAFHVMDAAPYNSYDRFIPMVDGSFDALDKSVYLAIKEGFDPTLDWDDVANNGLYQFIGRDIFPANVVGVMSLSGNTEVTTHVLNEWTTINTNSVAWDFDNLAVQTKQIGDDEMQYTGAVTTPIPVDFIYKVAGKRSSVGSVQTMQMGIFKNGVLLDKTVRSFTIDNGVESSVTVPIVLDNIESDDKFVLKVRNTTGTASAIYSSAILAVEARY